MKKKNILVILFSLLLLGGVAGGTLWWQVARKPLVDSASTWLYIRAGERAEAAFFDDWRMQLAMRWTGCDERRDACRLSGAYKITPRYSALAVARKLLFNQQDPVRMTFRGARLKEQVAGQMARHLACDSAEVLAAMLNPEFLHKTQFDTANVCSLFLPDTYETYWDVTPERLVDKMWSEYQKFWTPARLAAADSLHLTPREVSVLASIAEEETNGRQERGVVARLYWNRLQRGMLLQADPTVKYSVGDFTLRRILLQHLEVESPYNTYKYPGLPPGPIRVVEKATIDTILHARPNPYLYMCAKPDFSGRHNFAVTLSEHMKNADDYHRALSARLKQQ